MALAAPGEVGLPSRARTPDGKRISSRIPLRQGYGGHESHSAASRNHRVGEPYPTGAKPQKNKERKAEKPKTGEFDHR